MLHVCQRSVKKTRVNCVAADRLRFAGEFERDNSITRSFGSDQVNLKVLTRFECELHYKPSVNSIRQSAIIRGKLGFATY